MIKKKKQTIPVSIDKQEILLMLRAYQEHPDSWEALIIEMLENVNHLSDEARKRYKSSSTLWLANRVSGKICNLLSQKEPIKDPDIRMEVEKVRQLELHRGSEYFEDSDSDEHQLAIKSLFSSQRRVLKRVVRSPNLSLKLPQPVQSQQSSVQPKQPRAHSQQPSIKRKKKCLTDSESDSDGDIDDYSSYDDEDGDEYSDDDDYEEDMENSDDDNVSDDNSNDDEPPLKKVKI
ncbi:hypothetical protein KUTeg_011119 [Tegillarca granosa]|uniref:Uncharacterized protein n=1 Tax=Tegillarca granosa TaxID=220873 RepID=A0ABQ9F2W9_TEGGR|nr:hypothetical protein KUTeg_011119 [Tegillarca granosa]